MKSAERQTFYQIALIAILEVTTCLVYIYIQFFRTNQFVYYVGTFSFLLRQGEFFFYFCVKIGLSYKFWKQLFLEILVVKAVFLRLHKFIQNKP